MPDDEDFQMTEAEIAGPMGMAYSVTPCCHSGVRLRFSEGEREAIRRCRGCGLKYHVEIVYNEGHSRACWVAR